MKKNTILIAEDDDVSFIYFSESLSLNGIKVLRAHNGKDALDQIKDHPEIKLVLMDIKMPVMNGLEAIREIKKIRSDLPVIVESAYAMSEDKEEALEAGCDGYLSKPIRQDELYAVIRKYFDVMEG
jgi:CheY-like chemotaxis protein